MVLGCRTDVVTEGFVKGAFYQVPSHFAKALIYVGVYAYTRAYLYMATKISSTVDIYRVFYRQRINSLTNGWRNACRTGNTRQKCPRGRPFLLPPRCWFAALQERPFRHPPPRGQETRCDKYSLSSFSFSSAPSAFSTRFLPGTGRVQTGKTAVIFDRMQNKFHLPLTLDVFFFHINCRRPEMPETL